MLKNINTPELEQSLRAIAKVKTTQNIVPGVNYIPVTGKVLDEEDILFGVEAALDGWLTTGRFANEFAGVDVNSNKRFGLVDHD